MNENTNKDKILNCLKQENKILTCREICDKTGIPYKNLARETNELLKFNHIKKEQQGKLTCYSLVEPKNLETETLTQSPQLMPGYGERKTRARKVLEILKEKGSISRDELVKDYGFNNSNISIVFRPLIDNGTVKRIYHKHRVYYHLKDVPKKELKENILCETEIMTRQIPSLKAFLDDIKYVKKRSQNTIDNYAYNILRFYKFKSQKAMFKPIDITKITFNMITEFLIYLTDIRKNSNRTQVTILAALKSYFDFCEEKEFIVKNPMKRFKFPKIDEKPQIDIEYDEFKAMLEAATKTRDKLLLYVLFLTGIRREEFSQLNVSDIDFKNHTLLIKKAKGKKPRIVDLDPDIEAMIATYLQERPKILDANDPALFLNQIGSRLLYSSIGTIVRKLRIKAGITKKFGCHAMRRGYGRHAYENEVPLRVIQEDLGQRDINTTIKYVRMTEKFRREQSLKGKRRIMEDLKGGSPNAESKEAEPLDLQESQMHQELPTKINK